MVRQNLFHFPALDRHPRLAHHFGVLADPDDQSKFHADRLGVVGVLDPDVGVGYLGGREETGRQKFGDAAFAGRKEGEGGRRRGGVAEEKPVGGRLVGADGVVGGEDFGG